MVIGFAPLCAGEPKNLFFQAALSHLSTLGLSCRFLLPASQRHLAVKKFQKQSTLIRLFCDTREKATVSAVAFAWFSGTKDMFFR